MLNFFSDLTFKDAIPNNSSHRTLTTACLCLEPIDEVVVDIDVGSVFLHTLYQAYNQDIEMPDLASQVGFSRYVGCCHEPLGLGCQAPGPRTSGPVIP